MYINIYNRLKSKNGKHNNQMYNNNNDEVTKHQLFVTWNAHTLTL